jgi:hypothetical protein
MTIDVLTTMGFLSIFSNVNWLAIFAQVSPSDVNGVWLLFKNIISQAVDIFVPLVGVKHRRKLFASLMRVYASLRPK